MDEIFKDLVIIELASVLAGPAVGMFFAELGARVVKIENPKTNGDVTRSWKNKGEKSKTAAYFYSINYGKEHIFLDFSNDNDYDQFCKLLNEADVVISNFSDRTSQNLKLSYQHISALKPEIIYAQLFSFKNDSDRPAYDVILQAETGFLSMSGHSQENLAKMPVALIDVLAAHQLKEGLLIALLKKAKTGKGSYVSTSLEETAIASLANQATNYLMLDNIPAPLGTIHPNIAPYGDIVTTKDHKKIVLAVGSQKQFIILCTALNLEKLIEDPRFKTNETRVHYRTELMFLLQEEVGKLDSQTFLKICNDNRIPFGEIKNIAEVFETKTAKSMILESKEANNVIAKRVRTVAFRVE